MSSRVRLRMNLWLLPAALSVVALALAAMRLPRDHARTHFVVDVRSGMCRTALAPRGLRAQINAPHLLSPGAWASMRPGRQLPGRQGVQLEGLRDRKAA